MAEVTLEALSAKVSGLEKAVLSLGSHLVGSDQADNFAAFVAWAQAQKPQPEAPAAAAPAPAPAAP